MSTICVVQARMTSKRLPGKAMLSLGGEPAIHHVFRRCKQILGVQHVICTVPDDPMSAPIEREARRMQVGVSRGTENDVLGRYYRAACAAQADVIMRVTGDCPLIDPEICQNVLNLMEDGVEYASNVMPRGYPQGLDTECFTFAALEKAHKTADDNYDREHVCSWMQRNLYCVNLPGDPDAAEKRMCLDDLEDYRMLSEMFA